MRNSYGSYFLGLKIRGKGDEDAPLFVTDLFNTTDNTEVDIGTVTNDVTDSVTVKSTGGDGCYGCDRKSYSLFNLETQLELVEHYTTVMERELEEKENLENHPSKSSRSQAQKTENNESQVNDNAANEPSSSVTNTITDDEDDELKVGDRVRYVGKKEREYYGDEVMEVVKISVHWTGNQITCSSSKGWTTWISENCLKKVELQR